MNKKQKMAILILSIFIIGMCIGAADAAHTVKKGKTKVKITNKEYKKLTATKTQYKNVTKTRNVTKYKTVEKTKNVTKYNTVTKTRQVNKTKTETESVNTARLYQDYNYDSESGNIVLSYEAKRTMNQDRVNSLQKQGYGKNGTYTLTYYPNGVNDYWDYVDENGKTFQFAGYFESEFTNFTKTTTYLEDEEYTEDEPYTVEETYQEKVPYTATEKYKVKVPYKVRKSATVTKKVPKKYKTVKEAYYVWKKVKSYYTVSEWKYIGKSEIFGLQTPAMKKDTQKRVKKIRAAGWKINKDEHRSKYDLVDGGIYKHYYLCTKKVYYTEKKKVKKYKKVKKQVKIRIKSWAQNACPKGKVWVTLYCGDQLKKGECISEGYAKIK